MTSEWFLVEFYSVMEQKWVPLFGKFKDEQEAINKSVDLKAPKRVVKVNMTTTVVSGGK